MRVAVLSLLTACAGTAAQPLQSNRDVDRDGVADVRDKCAYHPGPDVNSGCPLQTAPPPSTPSPSPPPVATTVTPPPLPVATTTPPPPVTPPPPPTTTTPPPPVTPPTTTTNILPPPPVGGPYRADDPDRDGYPDSMDRCPDEPEDRDGVTDDDGCPE